MINITRSFREDLVFENRNVADHATDQEGRTDRKNQDRCIEYAINLCQNYMNISRYLWINERSGIKYVP